MAMVATGCGSTSVGEISKGPDADQTDDGTSGGTDPGTTTGGTTGTTGSKGLVPEFGDDPSFTVIGTNADGLRTVRDLEFHPQRTDELWTVNQATDSVVLFKAPGTPSQSAEVYHDEFSNHFMEEVSSLAFIDGDEFATAQETRNTYDGAAPPNDFMGPTLWPADTSIFAQVNQDPSGRDGLGSHLDMLHQSPLAMGIAHLADRKFFVFDGFTGDIVYYDFQDDHGPGGEDHTDGIVRRYSEVLVSRLPGVPSHMVVDKASGWMYIADTGNARILAMDTASGHSNGSLGFHFEILEEFVDWANVDFYVLVDSGLMTPSGIALNGDRLFVSDHDAGEIVAYDLDGVELDRIQVLDGLGVMGLAIGPDGDLWYADGVNDKVVRVDAG